MAYQKLPDLKILHDLPNPPKQLYYSGKLDWEIFGKCVAVVGSRKLTDYGKRVIEKLVPQLVFEKKTIASGFMYGTDQYAHKVCIENGGKTIAVLGWGIDKKLYGVTNPTVCQKFDKKLFGTDAKLAQEIIDSGGLLISEWETQEGTTWTFPVRDRIIAALSKEVFIVEAAEKSGSLITAHQAEKLHRQVWAVPGPITSKVSVGTNNLIATGRAKMWLPTLVTSHQSLDTSNPILDVLENEALTADELARKLQKSVTEIGAQLSLFSLSGTLTERGGKYYLADAG